jgi:uncharacterized membrane protein YfcA
MIPGACAGSVAGALLASSVSGTWVAIIFASYAGYFAVKMMIGRFQRCRRQLRIANKCLDRMHGEVV